MTTSSSPALIDIGANLGHSSFRGDRETVISAARDAGVAHIIVTGTDRESMDNALALSRNYPGYLTLTAGFHPHVARDYDAGAHETVLEFSTLPEVVAVGEMGLDFNRNYSPPEQQEAAFTSQLEIAVTAKKPVFLHQRDAHDRFVAILREYRADLPGGVVHCFTDTREALQDYLALDMYIGITGWICDDRRGADLQKLVAEIPLERLLLETDAPYLLPRTLEPRPASRRNEPRHLVEVLSMVSRCTGKPADLIAAATSANARRLFSLPD